MNDQLRGDEEFVIGAIADSFSAEWRAGENPPDAYLKVVDREVAIEISTLMQNQSDGRGGTRSRLSDDKPAARLVKELEKELQREIPHGYCLVLDLRTPISNIRSVKPKLKEIILDLISHCSTQTLKTNILGNPVTIKLNPYDGSTCVCEVLSASALPRYDNLSNTCYLLEERIRSKANKCRSLPFQGALWLALLDGYFLADLEMYQQAMKMFSVDHRFEKILLVSDDGSVNMLFENNL